MKEIPLTQGFVALVDDEVFEELNQFKWYARRANRRYYASRTVKEPPATIDMHLVVLPAPAGLRVDHIRHREEEKIIDNRRANLRICSHKENCRSSGKSVSYAGRTTCSVFKGVTRRKTISRPWVAQIYVAGKMLRLGQFSAEAHAAMIYDLAAVKHFGEFALTNFPVPGSTNWLYGPEVMHG